MEKPNFKKMCLMYIQQLTNFPYIEKDFDALTDYQLLCKVVAYLNKIITNENQQNETITALYNAFVELKDYVDNYFDNLDVQDEINNKLDEMAESGELQEIIARYINTSIFLKGMNVTSYYDETSSSNYYITEIPKVYENEEHIWKLGIAQDNTSFGVGERNVDFAIRKNATISINGGLFNPTTMQPHGVLIQNGVVLHEGIPELEFTTKILGIKSNGDLEVYSNTTSAQTLLDDGVINACVGYNTLIENGVPTQTTDEQHTNRQVICQKSNGDYVILTVDGGTLESTGMTREDLKRVLLEHYQDIRIAFILDGGGSTSTAYKYQKINQDKDHRYVDRLLGNFLYMDKEIEGHIDDKTAYEYISNLQRRLVKDINTLNDIWNTNLNIFAGDGYPSVNFFTNGNYSNEIGQIMMTANRFIVRKIDGENTESDILSVDHNSIVHNGVRLGNFYDYIGSSVENLNAIDNTGLVYSNNSLNSPSSTYYYVLTIFSSSNKRNGLQFAIPLINGNPFMCRRKVDNVWQDWYVANINEGSTSNRPTTNLTNGMCYFDATLKKPIWWYQEKWYDATGTEVV